MLANLLTGNNFSSQSSFDSFDFGIFGILYRSSLNYGLRNFIDAHPEKRKIINDIPVLIKQWNAFCTDELPSNEETCKALRNFFHSATESLLQEYLLDVILPKNVEFFKFTSNCHGMIHAYTELESKYESNKDESNIHMYVWDKIFSHRNSQKYSRLCSKSPVVLDLELKNLRESISKVTPYSYQRSFEKAKLVRDYQKDFDDLEGLFIIVRAIEELIARNMVDVGENLHLHEETLGAKGPLDFGVDAFKLKSDLEELKSLPETEVLFSILDEAEKTVKSAKDALNHAINDIAMQVYGYPFNKEKAEKDLAVVLEIDQNCSRYSHLSDPIKKAISEHLTFLANVKFPQLFKTKSMFENRINSNVYNYVSSSKELHDLYQSEFETPIKDAIYHFNYITNSQRYAKDILKYHKYIIEVFLKENINRLENSQVLAMNFSKFSQWISFFSLMKDKFPNTQIEMISNIILKTVFISEKFLATYPSEKLTEENIMIAEEAGRSMITSIKSLYHSSTNKSDEDVIEILRGLIISTEYFALPPLLPMIDEQKSTRVMILIQDINELKEKTKLSSINVEQMEELVWKIIKTRMLIVEEALFIKVGEYINPLPNHNSNDEYFDENHRNKGNQTDDDDESERSDSNPLTSFTINNLGVTYFSQNKQIGDLKWKYSSMSLNDKMIRM